MTTKANLYGMGRVNHSLIRQISTPMGRRFLCTEEVVNFSKHICVSVEVKKAYLFTFCNCPFCQALNYTTSYRMIPPNRNRSRVCIIDDFKKICNLFYTVFVIIGFWKGYVTGIYDS